MKNLLLSTLCPLLVAFHASAEPVKKCESGVNDVLRGMGISSTVTPSALSEKDALNQGQRSENDYARVSYTSKTDDWVASLKKAYQKDRYVKTAKNGVGPATLKAQKEIEESASAHWPDIQASALQDRKIAYDKSVVISGAESNSEKKVIAYIKDDQVVAYAVKGADDQTQTISEGVGHIQKKIVNSNLYILNDECKPAEILAFRTGVRADSFVDMTYKYCTAGSLTAAKNSARGYIEDWISPVRFTSPSEFKRSCIDNGGKAESATVCRCMDGSIGMPTLRSCNGQGSYQSAVTKMNQDPTADLYSGPDDNDLAVSAAHIVQDTCASQFVRDPASSPREKESAAKLSSPGGATQ